MRTEVRDRKGAFTRAASVTWSAFPVAVWLALLGLLSFDRSAARAAKIEPYYASLKADLVHVRKGPGRKYDIMWSYKSLGLPVEVTAEFEHWRRIRDSVGNEGWVYFRLLSRLRMALVAPWEKKKTIIALRKGPDNSSPLVANLQPGVKLLVRSCNGHFCQVSLEGFHGWLPQNRLWGVYPGEIIK